MLHYNITKENLMRIDLYMNLGDPDSHELKAHINHLSMREVIYHSIQAVYGIAEISPERSDAIHTLTASAGKQKALYLLKKSLLETKAVGKNPHIKALTLWLKLARAQKYFKKSARQSRRIESQIESAMWEKQNTYKKDFISPYD